MNVLSEITDEEFDRLAHTMSERIKNIVFMRAEDRAREVLKKFQAAPKLSPNDSLEINYNVHFLVNDAIEIIGGLRRKK